MQPKKALPALKIAFKRKTKKFTNTSFGDTLTSEPDADTAIFSDQSMDLTNPNESNIIMEKPKKPSKVSKKSKSTKNKSTPKVKFTEETMEKDVYNCSADSFLTNPDKRIEVMLFNILFSDNKSIQKVKKGYG